MSRNNVFKLPAVENSFVLDSKYTPPEDEEREKEKIIEDITKESYQRGWDEAIEKSREDADLICQSLNKAIEDLKQERDSAWSKCENGIVKLAFAIAKKTVYETISEDSGKIIEKVVSDAINRVKEKNILSVCVNPADAEKLKDMKIGGTSSDGEIYEIIKDDKISRGGCKVVTDCGGVDAMVETRWNEIALEFGEHNIETVGTK